MKTIKIALLGAGTVGTATYKLLQMNAQKISIKTGVLLEISKILVRNMGKTYDVPDELLTSNFEEILNDPDIQIIVELMGGIEPASSYILQAMSKGKHVITANKAAVAENYEKFIAASSQLRVMFRFEAAVAGGIPVLDALQAPLNSNDIEEVTGIINGTTNFILSQMTEHGLTYSEALEIAQAKGFAEADPTADVDGTDIANKLSILIALAFGEIVRVEQIRATGISGLSFEDIRIAQSFGYKIKLLATAKKTETQLQATVQPTLVPFNHMLAGVSNEFNALFIHGNAVGDLLFYGKGAGGLPTASAVIGDTIEIANAIDKKAAFDSYINKIPDIHLNYVGEGINSYYLRLTGANAPGVLGSITTTLGKKHISIQSVTQQENGETAQMYFIVHQTSREQLDSALEYILEKGYAISVDSVLRVL